MVDSGQVTAADKAGNDAADEAADEGVKLFTPTITALSEALADRHTSYSTNLRTLMQHIAFVYQVRAVLLKQSHDSSAPQAAHTASQRSQPPHIPATTPPYHDSQHTHPQQYLQQLIRIEQCPNALSKHPSAPDVQQLLRTMPFLQADARDKGVGQATVLGIPTTGVGTDIRVTNNGTAEGPVAKNMLGITWLELYVVYRLAGHPPPISPAAQPAISQPMLRQQLHTFRVAVRTIFRLTVPEPQHHLIKGAATTTRRLAGLGITTFLATLPWQPDLTPAAQNQVAIEVLRSQNKLTKQRAEQTLQQHKPVALRRLQLKGRARWGTQLKASRQPIYHKTHLPSQSPASTEAPNT